MSAKQMKFKVVKVASKSRPRGRARISNCCTHRRDNAVEGVQEAGHDLGRLFNHLQDRDNAALLVRGIRCKNRRLVEDLIGRNCNVVCFFNQGRFSCVRISCVFGECCDVRITFDICVSNVFCRDGI